MAKKNKAPGGAQAEVMKRSGLNPLVWEVLQDLSNSMIVRHRITGEVRVIEKQADAR